MATKDIFVRQKQLYSTISVTNHIGEIAVTLVKFRQNLAAEKGPLPIA